MLAGYELGEEGQQRCGKSPADFRQNKYHLQFLRGIFIINSRRWIHNKEIGARLDIAENTVKNHLKNILAKLHLQNRVQAAALAIQKGMLTVRSPF